MKRALEIESTRAPGLGLKPEILNRQDGEDAKAGIGESDSDGSDPNGSVPF